MSALLESAFLVAGTTAQVGLIGSRAGEDGREHPSDCSVHTLPPHTRNPQCRPSMQQVEDRLRGIEGSRALDGYTSYQEGGCCGCTVS